MFNIIYKKVRKFNGGKIEVEFLDSYGNTKKEMCHNPVSCKKHASLFAPLAAGLGTMIEGLPEEDDVEYVSAADYETDSDKTI